MLAFTYYTKITKIKVAKWGTPKKKKKDLPEMEVESSAKLSSPNS
jgi:hypothetical protein